MTAPDVRRLHGVGPTLHEYLNEYDSIRRQAIQAAGTLNGSAWTLNLPAVEQAASDAIKAIHEDFLSKR